MIEKEKVLKIIEDNDESRNETKKLRNNDKVHNLSESRIKLREFIAALPSDELWDLLALMDYGREILPFHKQPEFTEFTKFRKNIETEELTVDNKMNKAAYMLVKRDFSKYLTAVLPIYNFPNFKF